MKGTHKNRPADALSRIRAKALDTYNMFNFREMAAAQRNDPDLERLRETSSLIFRDVPLPTADGTATGKLVREIIGPRDEDFCA